MKTKFIIKGLHCKGCINVIQEELMLTSAIDSVSIDLKTGVAQIKHSSDITVIEIIKKIKGLHYIATLDTNLGK